MEFYEVLDQVIDLLKLRKCVTYRACKAQFQLDEALLETLNDELLFSHSVVDENGEGLSGPAASHLHRHPCPRTPGPMRLSLVSRNTTRYLIRHLT